MQGLVQSINPPRYTKDVRSIQVPSKVTSQINAPRNGGLKLGQLKESFSSPSSDVQNKGRRSSEQKRLPIKDKLQISQMRDFGQVQRRQEDESPDKFTHRSVQTEKSDDVQKIYQNGTIRYASSSVINELGKKTKSKPQMRHQDRGDASARSPTKNEISSRLQGLELEDRDFIKENMKAIKQKSQKCEASFDPNRAPPTYQRGVLPKYLKEKKDDTQKEVADDPECPPGHVLLPDEERKETLRVLRQSKYINKMVHIHIKTS